MDYIAVLSRSNGQWSNLVGNPAGTYYPSADSLIGSSIKLSGFYPGLILGINNTATKLATALFDYSGGYINSFVKTFTKANGTQDHLVGKAGASTTAICAHNTSVTNCTLPAGDELTNFTHDSTNNRWIFAQKAYSRIVAIPDSGVGNLVELATVPRAVQSLTHHNNKLYYCGRSNGRIYQWDLASPGEVALPWAISTLQCTGNTLLYSSSRNSLIFAYKQDDLYGIAEYALP